MSWAMSQVLRAGKRKKYNRINITLLHFIILQNDSDNKLFNIYITEVQQRHLTAK